MEIALDDDQEFFRETTVRFLGQQCPLSTVRQLADSPVGFEEAYWTQGAELGWTSFLVPEADGGGSLSSLGVADLAIVADAFGHHTAPGPLLPVNVVAAALGRSGSDTQRADLLPGLLDGGLVAAWCGAEQALGEASVRAEATAGGWVLRGESGPVEAGAQAHHLLVTAAADDGPVQVLLPIDAPGLDVQPLQSLDLVRRYARVRLDDVTAAPEQVLGTREGTAADVEHQLQVALAVQTAEMVGAAQRAFDITLEWAFDRYSFGRPLASYQELKHRFADMKLWLEASHALAAELARAVGHDPAAAEMASVAKAYAGQFLAMLAQDCIQLHGGIGLTTEHDLHLFVRRITVDRSTLGLPARHRRRVAEIRTRAVLEEDAA